MIITLTPNPSLDLLFTADRLRWDDANRVPMPRRRPGGQGINVARAAGVLAGADAAHAIAPLGGPVGRELRTMLEAEGTRLTAVPIRGETRVFVGVRESASGRSLLLNPRGPEVTEEEADALLDAVDAVLDRDGPVWLAACGSLLPGLPADFYARAGRIARSRGARFVPDGDGEALAAAADEADLLVPNELEAGRLLGRTIETPADAARAGRELLARGPDLVVVTLGARGAVAVDSAGAWWARPEPPEHQAETLATASAVGAGDAFLAGLIGALDRGAGTRAALADAVAAGTAVLLSEGTDLITAADVRRVREWVVTETSP